VVDTKKDPAFPQNSGVPEFCHDQWRKSETSDLRTRVFPSSAMINGASRKHPTCTDIGFTRYRHIKARKSETSDLRCSCGHACCRKAAFDP
jgi:hypothetical protein